MNWSFWTRTQPSAPELTGLDTCDTLDPLLSLYADRMASPDEARRVEAHLPECEACRESLRWMQATRRALASRPLALPPAGLQAQIARAIAASAVPSVAARPARVFALRPAYAAAASLTVLGAILASHSLLTTRSAGPTAKTPKVTAPLVAALPPVTVPSPSSVVPLPTVKHPALMRVKPHPLPAERVALVPDEAPVPPRVEIAPALSSPVKRSVRAMLTHLPLIPARQPVRPKASDALMTAKVSTPRPLEFAPPVSPPIEKPSGPVVASAGAAPAVTIGAPTVTPQEPATVKVAAREGLLASVVQHIGLMHTAAYSTMRKSIKDTAFVAETGLPDKTPAVGTITRGDWH